MASRSNYKGSIPEYDTNLMLDRGILQTIEEHTKYQCNLSHWKKFIIWVYSFDSKFLNEFLINGMGKDLETDDKMIIWVANFFKLYNFQEYGEEKIEHNFKNLSHYFQNPGDLKNDPDRYSITREVFQKFSVELNQIVLDAPKTRFKLTLFKGSRTYDELPHPELLGDFRNREFYFEQNLFNSTTYDPNFNFTLFVGGNCCLHELTIPKGSRLLFISPTIHAYPFEREVLLPVGVTFNFVRAEMVNIDLPSDEHPPIKTVQKEPYHIGEVFRPLVNSCPMMGMREIKLFSVNVEKVPGSK